ncbi:hypothetical protein ACV22Y_32765 [Burkholderia sp. AW50-3]
MDDGVTVDVLLQRRKISRGFSDRRRRRGVSPSNAPDVSRQIGSVFSHDGINLVPYYPREYDGTIFYRVSEPKPVRSLDSYGFKWFAQSVDLSADAVSSVPLRSTEEISAWLGLGEFTNRGRFSEPLSEAAPVRVTPRKLVANLDTTTSRYFGIAYDATLRRYGVLEAAHSKFVIPLPVERIHQDRFSVDVRLSFHARDDSTDPQKIKVEAKPTEPMLDSLLALVYQGQIASARSVIDASSMLFEKFENPYLAALGAHVLLGADGAVGDDRWHGWVENLARHFPLIPDGKIVLAALMLRRGSGLRTISRTMSDYEIVQKAKRVCLEALEAGLPQYSASVRLLAQLAGIIAGFEQGQDRVLGGDGEVTQKLLDLTQWLSARVDPGQGLTVAQIEHDEAAYA